MNNKAKNLVNIILKLTALQVLLIIWKMILGQLFVNQDNFTDKMITMLGMLILTLLIIISSWKKNIKLSFLPQKFSYRYMIGTIIAVIFLVTTPSNYVDGIRGPILLLYASIITPLYEELLFRGYVWNQLDHIYKSRNQIIWINTILFSIWHLGYITDALIAGEWIALSKLVIGFTYGIIICFIRFKTKNCYSTFLVHGILNAFLG